MTSHSRSLIWSTGLALAFVAPSPHAIECPPSGSQQYLIRFDDPSLRLLQEAVEKALAPFGFFQPTPGGGGALVIQFDDPATVEKLRSAKIPGITLEPRFIRIETPAPPWLTVPSYGKQWYYDKIMAGDAWSNVKRSVSSGSPPFAQVAVLDSGIDDEHCALRMRMWSASGSAAAQVPCASSVPPPPSYPANASAHGTQVAGIIGAESAEGALRPLAPNARIVDLDISKEYNYETCIDPWKAAENIRKAAELRVPVANLSWNLSYNERVLDALKAAKDVLFVVAADNNEEFVDNSYSYPIWYDLQNVISVTSSKREDAAVLNKGARIDIAAPGYDIESTLPNNSRGPMTGTSAAAPMVSATALLLKSLAPDWSPEQLKHYLVDSADRIPQWPPYGFGRLNAARATAAPVTISWPVKDSRVNTNTRDQKLPAILRVKWQSTFVSYACRTLDIYLALDGEEFKLKNTNIDVLRNRHDISIPRYYTKGGRVRLQCSGTQLIAESGVFQFYIATK